MDRDLDEKAPAMTPAKRPAETTESPPIPSEKRLMISPNQLQDNEHTNDIPEDCPPRVFCPMCDDSANHILEDCPRRFDKAWLESPLFCYTLRRTDPNVTPKTTRDEPAFCFLCKEITDHYPAYCKKSVSSIPDTPSPTPDDVENNRSYCSICLNYTDHDYNDCPRVVYDEIDSSHDSEDDEYS